ncbi:TonB-dependent receptor [Nafulsella turpanensis]|uniref:TonB-dependent receptor n=1 Tax=Nafulsella turpanensis TaxID=1265690 RepID=UPI00034D59B2|nr:TonB-dependent receptor [Nafulsella turpanensis]
MRRVSVLFIWCSIFSLTVLTAAGQSVVITGQVSRANTGKPVAGADIFIQGTPVNTTTNGQGKYTLPLSKGGTYTLAVFSHGLRSQVRQVEIADNTRIEINFSLEELEEVLEEVTISEQRNYTGGITRLNAVEGTAIYEGKKNEVIVLEDITANLATNNSRQIYAKVPGLNIWESDGAGLQLGIGGRGLSPNRTSNFNTRQNGYDISADALGYPESYYTPPAEALERIQIVRGAASLQYGTQFGGMLNFILKDGPSDTPLEFTTRQTIGSFGLFNSFNSLGGTVGSFNYYTFYQHKQGDGWRPNSGFEVDNFFGDFQFSISDKFSLGLEYTHMNYLAQQPGGLTDEQFLANPQLSFRDRNWFKVNWNLGAVLMEYRFSDKTRLESRTFGLYAGRDALGDLDPLHRPTGEYRTLIQDTFRNFGNETRLMQHYSLKGRPAVLLLGTRYYQGLTHKMQGVANSGSEPAFQYLNPDSLVSDHLFPNRNLAFFAENIFPINDQWSITPGIRYEWIDTRTDGYYQEVMYIADENGLPVETTRTQLDKKKRQRPVWLAGVGISYKPHLQTEFYGNISRNYRAINFTDLRMLNPNMYVDPNLTDESGYSADLGWRGRNSWLNYDMSLFYLKYKDKISTINENRKGIPVRARRNISDAFIAGMESFVQADIMQLLQPKPAFHLNLYLNLALIEGRYYNSEQTAFRNKKVELVPPVNIKSGLSFRKNTFAASLQYSYVATQFTDADNTNPVTPLPGAVIGPIPAFYVMDLSLQYGFKQFTFESGINNLTDNRYFTRRADGYPGPGIIPSDARSFYLTLGFNFRKK